MSCPTYLRQASHDASCMMNFTTAVCPQYMHICQMDATFTLFCAGMYHNYCNPFEGELQPDKTYCETQAGDGDVSTSSCF